MESKGGSQTDGNHKTPQIIPVKLPLAPIVSTSSDRRRNATVSTRRGSAIFSPTQTPDQHGRPPPQLHRQPPLPQLPLVYKDPTTPDPDPAPAPAVHGASNSMATPPSPDLHPPAVSGFNDTFTIRYRECLKNHAASIGGHVVDGCGEFMSSGEDGTPEALRCAACDCHRNFHRKEVEGQPPQTQIHPFNIIPHRKQEQKYQKSGGDTAAESSSEDLNMLESSGHAAKKRFRTKFSQQQKHRMQEFAAKLDWKIQKQKDDELQRFCTQIGVKRQVFKVWMHNNKQSMKRKQI